MSGEICVCGVADYYLILIPLMNSRADRLSILLAKDPKLLMFMFLAIFHSYLCTAAELNKVLTAPIEREGENTVEGQ